MELAQRIDPFPDLKNETEVYIKMKGCRKVSLLLSIVMILSLLAVGLAVPISAAEPVAVTSAGEFAAMSWNGSYYLANDITLTEKWNNTGSGQGFFGGTFDGRGHTITLSGCSMFSYMGTNATITDLNIAGTLPGSEKSAALCGSLDSTNVYNIHLENIWNDATVSGTPSSYSGGLIGDTSTGASNKITVINCTNTGYINAPNGGAVGGLIGSVRGGTLIMTGCTNIGNVVGKQDAGGLVGRFWNGGTVTITNCKNSGNVSNSTNMYAGGAIGWLAGTLTLTNFTNYGVITGSGSAMGAGGFVGGAHTTEDNNSTRYFDATITKCLNVGRVSTGSGYAGAFVGRSKGAAATGALDISECIDNGGNANRVGYQDDSQTTADYSKTESQIENLGYCGGPTPISSGTQFLRMKWNDTYYLAADISISQYWTNSTSGSSQNFFAGTLDGRNHTVTVSGCAMFSNLGGNAYVKNVTIEGTISGNYLAGLSGQTDGGNIFHIRVENVTNKASGSSSGSWGYGGGLFGDCNVKDTSSCSMILINCKNSGNIDAPDHSAVGGLIGSLRGGELTLINCVNTGNLVGAQDAGGLVGRFWKGGNVTIQNCLNTGNVANYTNMYAGGAIGWLRGVLTLNNFTNEGKITSNNSGTVAMGAGGFVGGAHKTSDEPFNATITKCLNKGTVSGGGSIGAFVGCAKGSSSTSVLNISECIDKSGNANLVGVAASNGTVDTSKTESQIKNLGYGTIGVQSAQPSLGEDIALYFTVRFCISSDYQNQLKVTATMNEKTVEMEPLDDVDSDGNLCYAFHIAPQNMNDEITVTVDFYGVEQSQLEDYTFRSYCTTMLAKTNSELGLTAAKKTQLDQLLKDMLAYGAAAQTYKGWHTDSLANEGISGASVYSNLGESANTLAYTKNGGYSGDVALSKVGMYFDYNNRLSLVLTGVADMSNIGITVGGNALTLEENVNYIELDGSYRIYFKDLTAADICSGTGYTVVISDGGTTVGTLTYSAKSYVYMMQGRTDNMGALAKALYNYSVSAVAYAD